MSTRSADTVAAALAQGAARHGAETFLVAETPAGGRLSVSWAEMDARATRTARLLRSLGLRIGDRFNVHTANCPEFYDLWFGAARMGAVLVPSDPLHTPDELGYLLARSRCRVTFVQAPLRDTAVRACVQATDCTHLLVVDGDGNDAFGAARDAQSDAPWDPERDGPGPGPHDLLGVLHAASGPGPAEEVPLSHAAYLGAGRNIAGRLRMGPEDRQLIVLPLFRGNSQQYASMSALVSGGSIALAPGFTAARWAGQATALQATLAGLLPAPLCMLLAREESVWDTAHGLRAVIATQKVSEERTVSFEKRFQVSLLQLYGMQETVAPVLASAQARRRKRERGAPTRRARGGRTGPEGVRRSGARLARVHVVGGPAAVGGVPGRSCEIRSAGFRADLLSSLRAAGCRRPVNERAEAE
ncbi:MULTISPECIES: AMP-binding protein [Streptomyces]|uniref:AMP-binding protein n=1 Tax=Streptomyces ramulosus TaxID=47762 RepID=A0ABW1FF70_9ACTN